jgi:predicted metal-dependent hydrolase
LAHFEREFGSCFVGDLMMGVQKKIRDDANAKPARRIKRELLKIDGKSIEVILRTNPRARRFIVKVDPSTGEVSVVSPSSRSFERALDFARKEKDWIAGRLADIPQPVQLDLGSTVMFKGVEYAIRAGEGKGAPVWIDREAYRPTIRVGGRPEHASRRLLDWLKREARTKIDERVAHHAAQLGVRPKRITIRDTSSRWGSCSSARSLSFSWRLVLAPPQVLDYVVAHEVSHLRELNHKPRFWRLVQGLVPEIEKSQNWLSDHGALLHRYAPRNRFFE